MFWRDTGQGDLEQFRQMFPWIESHDAVQGAGEWLERLVGKEIRDRLLSFAVQRSGISTKAVIITAIYRH